MNKILFGAALSALALAAPAIAQAQRTPAAVIVLVDRARLYGECNACKVANTQLQALVTSAQQQANTIRQPIETEQQSIAQAARAAEAMPAGAARTAAENTVKQRIAALQQRGQTAQQQLNGLDQNFQSTQANVLRQIDEKVDPIITQVMNAHGANIAMDMRNTFAHAQGVDVTNEVLAALNTQLPTISVTPLPQAPAPAQPQGR